MTSSQPDLLKPAKQGNIEAIAALMNRLLQPKNITAKASLKDNCLQMMLESEQVPNQQVLVEFVRKSTVVLGLESIQKLRVYGRQIGEDFPAWQQELDVSQATLSLASSIDSEQISVEEMAVAIPEVTSILKSLPETASQPQKSEQPQRSLWGSVFGAVTGAAGTVGSAATHAGGAVVGTAVGIGSVVGNTAAQAGGAVVGTAIGAGGAIGNAAVQAGGAVVGTAVGVGGAVGNAAWHATDGIGYVLDTISHSPQLQELTKAVKVDWLVRIIDQVDVVKAETHVKNLQRKYPQEKPSDIAHRLMLEKALYVGGSGLSSSLVPGFAAALFAVDLAATTAIQAEMGYQIACAYGFDLNEPARKGEIVAVFGLALGGSYALKAGLGFLRNIPMAGAVIGASSNAAALYAVGYAACHFYEAKLNPTSPDAKAAASPVESEEYLKQVVAQQAVMDQILAHLILAGNPSKTWQQILPELQTLSLSPTSLEAIAVHIKSPIALETLLNQLEPDFAVPLIALSQKIAELDGVTTPEEAQMIEQIKTKFPIEAAFSE
ncbi:MULTISPECIES: hypothetical protein [Trichocoleus]|uniref:Uncharacterized protein n=1 Tax=Trichocoleus desertorum GB2-A4 TaxID=2933944 RepID=A0ABV0J6Y0_9CYAN|nr:hypothetical protein [Trichocoleus sp. FACHB-46]MBD1863864.1 hypothetical protein [Trichocoleus sp. FACHB-46]